MDTEQNDALAERVLNPFAVAAPSEHMNVGTVTIEEARAVAEVKAKLFAAKTYPRDKAAAFQSIMDACRRPALAGVSMYAYPKGGGKVRGPSIRLAEVLAAAWGNVSYGLRELSRKPGVSEMQAYCWDMQTNTESLQNFTVKHEIDLTGGLKKILKDEREIYELTANAGARRMRARILAIIPPDVIEAAIEECRKTMAGDNKTPLIDRVRKMVGAFADLGVSLALIEKQTGKKLEDLLPDDLADLQEIYRSIKDEMTSASQWFDTKAEAAGNTSAAITDSITKTAKPSELAQGSEGKPAKK